MENFSQRLKEERERLGLSQAKFAELCGIGKSAQYSYENGGREPPLSYMRAAASIGVDILYVQQGVRIGRDWAFARAYMRLLERVDALLYLEEGALEKICSRGADIDFDDTTQTDTLSLWTNDVRAWLATSSKPDACLSVDVLAYLLDAVENSANHLGLTMPTQKRVRAAMMLYPLAKPVEYVGLEKLPFSKVDQWKIDEVVKMAAS